MKYSFELSVTSLHMSIPLTQPMCIKFVRGPRTATIARSASSSLQQPTAPGTHISPQRIKGQGDRRAHLVSLDVTPLAFLLICAARLLLLGRPASLAAVRAWRQRHVRVAGGQAVRKHRRKLRD